MVAASSREKRLTLAAAVLKRKLSESGLHKVPVHIVEPGKKFQLGPFGVEMVPHQIEIAQR